jgi:hypothetical protein
MSKSPAKSPIKKKKSFFTLGNKNDTYKPPLKSKQSQLRKQGVYYDPVNADPLSSRLVHRFMFAEFLGSLFSNLIAQGAVISCGALTYQFNYDELTPGRILCIAFATSFVSF